MQARRLRIPHDSWLVSIGLETPTHGIRSKSQLSDTILKTVNSRDSPSVESFSSHRSLVGTRKPRCVSRLLHGPTFATTHAQGFMSRGCFAMNILTFRLCVKSLTNFLVLVSHVINLFMRRTFMTHECMQPTALSCSIFSNIWTIMRMERLFRYVECAIHVDILTVLCRPSQGIGRSFGKPQCGSPKHILLMLRMWIS
jgi:hypothetical protein